MLFTAKVRAAFDLAVRDPAQCPIKPKKEWGAENEAGDDWVNVAPDAIAVVGLFLRDDSEMKFDGCQCISGMDWGDKLGVVYHLYSYSRGHRLVIHVDVDRVAHLWAPELKTFKEMHAEPQG